MVTKHIIRYPHDLNQYCQPGKVLVVYGARQVGKTTLVNQYLQQTNLRYKLDSGDNIFLQNQLEKADFQTIQAYLEGYELIIIDEAQMIPNIGQCLKIMVDQNPQLRIIVTGSSTFDLAGQVGEPLTGRKRILTLYPIAQLELRQIHNTFEIKQNLKDYLIYGSYPEVITANTYENKRDIITEITQSYLFKDILALERIKNSRSLQQLLTLLALQLGDEVSHHELGQKIGLDNKTIARYLDLLEKTFVIYSLSGFSRNLRNEITKKRKYYFYDNGIRNALIANFSSLDKRNDIGALWENFIIGERLKRQSYLNQYANYYFWRTWSQQEIDLIEEHDGQLFAYEFKWQAQNESAPKAWREAYPNSAFNIIDSNNYLAFVT